jgi:hypothetical protein
VSSTSATLPHASRAAIDLTDLGLQLDVDGNGDLDPLTERA